MPCFVSKTNGMVFGINPAVAPVIDLFRKDQDSRSVIDMTATDRANINEVRNDGKLDPEFVKTLSHQAIEAAELEEKAASESAALTIQMRQAKIEREQQAALAKLDENEELNDEVSQAEQEAEAAKKAAAAAKKAAARKAAAAKKAAAAEAAKEDEDIL